MPGHLNNFRTRVVRLGRRHIGLRRLKVVVLGRRGDSQRAIEIIEEAEQRGTAHHPRLVGNDRERDEQQLARAAVAGSQFRLDVTDGNEPGTESLHDFDAVARGHGIGGGIDQRGIVSLGKDGAQAAGFGALLGQDFDGTPRQHATQTATATGGSDRQIGEQATRTFAIQLEDQHSRDRAHLWVTQPLTRDQKVSLRLRRWLLRVEQPFAVLLQIFLLVGIGETGEVEILVNLLKQTPVVIVAQVNDVHESLQA